MHPEKVAWIGFRTGVRLPSSPPIEKPLLCKGFSIGGDRPTRGCVQVASNHLHGTLFVQLDADTKRKMRGVRRGSDSPRSLRRKLHQNNQIRTASLQRSCSDLFFMLIIHIETYRREPHKGTLGGFFLKFILRTPIPRADSNNQHLADVILCYVLREQ